MKRRIPFISIFSIMKNQLILSKQFYFLLKYARFILICINIFSDQCRFQRGTTEQQTCSSSIPYVV